MGEVFDPVLSSADRFYSNRKAIQSPGNHGRGTQVQFTGTLFSALGWGIGNRRGLPRAGQAGHDRGDAQDVEGQAG